MMSYKANEKRYQTMTYKHCGKSGLKLPLLSLGLWHNFGDSADPKNCLDILTTAFDGGITHFDLANNYGPAAGAAETLFGKLLKSDLGAYRDELVISTKAGYYMWEGPYGDYGSKKYITASLNQSLKRMGLEYVDIFYHHRPDPNTPLEETAHALDLAVRQGKALYIGISNYRQEETRKIAEIFKDLKTPFIIHQPVYNMLNRWIEDGLTDVLDEFGIGCIPFSPLAQGVLTNRYLEGIPKDSRAALGHFLNEERVSQNMATVKSLKAIADRRNQTIAQLAIAWILQNPTVTSVLIGASRPAQITENLKALENLTFTKEELAEIKKIIT